MNDTPIYLDYAASTPLDAAVAATMLEVERHYPASASASHPAGRAAAAVVATAARQLGGLLGCEPDDVVFTSGATESNNLAIRGVAEQRAHRGRHLVTSRTEHKAVVDVFRALERDGFAVTWLTPDADGCIDPLAVVAALRADTQLVSLMHVNNETGQIADIASIGRLCREHGVLLHVDGAQAAGKIGVDLGALPVDLYSLTAHKFYGPKGVGALFVRRGTGLRPLFYGGGQQRRLRPGTLPVGLLAGLGKAAELAAAALDAELERLAALRARLFAALAGVDGLLLNSPASGGYPGILNVSVSDVDGESLLLAMEPVSVAAGSACNAQSREPSYVLRALGRSDREAEGAVRFSFGRGIDAADIDVAAARYCNAVARLRALAPAAR